MEAELSYLRPAVAMASLPPEATTESSRDVADFDFDEKNNKRESLQNVADLYLNVEMKANKQRTRELASCCVLLVFRR